MKQSDLELDPVTRGPIKTQKLDFFKYVSKSCIQTTKTLDIIIY